MKIEIGPFIPHLTTVREFPVFSDLSRVASILFSHAFSEIHTLLVRTSHKYVLCVEGEPSRWPSYLAAACPNCTSSHCTSLFLFDWATLH